MSRPFSPEEPSRLLKTVATTLRVIDELKRTHGMSAAELSDELELSRTTAYNHLTTLREHGYVVKDDDEYRLSAKCVLLGEDVRQQNILYKHGHAELKELAEETGEYAQLVVEEFGRGLIVSGVRGEKAVGEEFQAKLQRQPFGLHYTAAGKAILAHLPRERVEAFVREHGLSQKTAETITDRDRLFDVLSEIRDRGYAYNDEEQVEGLRVVGAPILNPDDEVLGAVSLSGPTSRIQDQRYRETLPERVLNTANLIEVNINMAHRS